MKPAVWTLLLLPIVAPARLQEPAEEAAEPGWESAVAALYEVISGPAGQERDWERFLGMFAEGANLMVSLPEPAGASRLLVMTPAEYVEQSGPRLVEVGFHERELGRRAERFGNLVQVFSAYEGVLGGAAGAKSLRGVNSIQLVRTRAGWRIANLVWEAATPENPLPEALLAPAAGEAR